MIRHGKVEFLRSHLQYAGATDRKFLDRYCIRETTNTYRQANRQATLELSRVLTSDQG